MKRKLSVISLFLTFIALTGCINTNEKSKEDPAKIELETVYRNTDESLKLIQPKIKDGMSADDIMKKIFYTKFPDIHEVTDQEINEMFSNLPESTQKEYNEKWNKDSDSTKKQQRFTFLEKQITEKYSENYFYMIDLGTKEKTTSTGVKIPINDFSYFIRKNGSGYIRVYDYLSKENAKIENNYARLPQNKDSRFGFDVTYTIEESEPKENRLLWKEFDVIFKKIDLSLVN